MFALVFGVNLKDFNKKIQILKITDSNNFGGTAKILSNKGG